MDYHSHLSLLLNSATDELQALATEMLPDALTVMPSHKPLAVRELALRLSPVVYRTVTWREGTAGMMRWRFAAVRVRAAHRDYWQAVPHGEQWLLIEWPKASVEPAKYWLATSRPPRRLRSWSGAPSCAGESSGIILNSSRSWDSTTSRAVPGADFTIMPRSALPPTASWSPNAALSPR